MPRFLSAEAKARARELYEGTTLSHARIGAAAGMGASTVSVLAQIEGWTRHPEARTSPRLAEDRRAAILRLRRAGAPAGDIAAAAGCHRNTIGRIAPLAGRRGVAIGPEAAAGSALIPAHFAELHAALTNPQLHKAEAVPLLLRCATALGAEALLRQDAEVERTAQALGRLAEGVAALPDEGPYAGRGADDAYGGPQTFEEENAVLEELARRIEEWNATDDAEEAGAAARALDVSEADAKLR